MMTLVPLTQCSQLLSVDAKTLRQWLKQANLPLHPHPTDARIRGLTTEQVHQLATLHGRAIKPDGTTSSQLGLLEPPPQASSVLPRATLQGDADLASQLSSLQATVITLQQQVSQLALELLHERERRLEIFVQQAGPQQIQTTLVDGDHLDAPKSQGRPLHPAERPPARWRLGPLIEYVGDDSYVIIDPKLGECHFGPNSPSWFDWLARLSCFRFVGSQGRFSAYRKGHSSRGWSARRFFHGHNYKLYLGSTDLLTIHRLEQVAADLHSLIASL